MHAFLLATVYCDLFLLNRSLFFRIQQCIAEVPKLTNKGLMCWKRTSWQTCWLFWWRCWLLFTTCCQHNWLFAYLWRVLYLLDPCCICKNCNPGCSYRASGKVWGCDPALSTKNRTISHYSLFPALCRTFRVYLLKKPISYKITLWKTP